MRQSRPQASNHSTKSNSAPAESDHVNVLPLELWRVVFLYLPLRELCRSAQVCREWCHLVSSLDSTVWKRLFLQHPEWKHPLWPQMDSGEETLKSWHHLYREHFYASRAWLRIKDIPSATSCISIFPRKRDRKIIRVGARFRHESLRSALSVAGEYDRVVISPGFYDEQFEMFSKIPFELVGEGGAENVVLVMSIEQNAVTGRLCNLTLKAPWFTSHVIKVKHGHLQMENCVIEEGVVAVEHPATCHFRYCKFRKAQMMLSHLSLSIVENCEFTGLDAAAISVEGYPREQKNWAHEHMYRMIDTWGLCKHLHQQDDLFAYQIPFQDSHSLSTLKLQSLSVSGDAKHGDEDSIGGAASIAGSQTSVADTGNTFDASSFSSDFTEPDESKAEGHQWNSEETSAALAAAQASLDRPSSGSSSSSAASGLSAIHRGLLTSLWQDEHETVENILRFNFEASLETDDALREAVLCVKGCVIRHCRMKDCHGGLAVSQQGQARLEKCELLDLLYGVRCVQNAKVAVLGNTIHHCVTSGIFFRSAAHGLIGGNDVYCTNEAGIDIRKSADPLVQCNRLHHSKRSGIVVLGSGCGTIKCNDIYQNREAGIYILYRGNPYVSGNRIVHGGAAGIAINEEGRGCIVENVIKGNRWGGIDIRKGSDPLIAHNYVCNGLADGIVIGQNGRGRVEGNTIKGNVGCGVWVMGGQPLIQLNQIYNNNDTGVSFIQTRDVDEDLSMDGGESDSIASVSPVDFEGDTSDSGGGAENNQSDDSNEPPHPRLKYNTIYHNNGFGVLTQCGEQILLQGNAVHSNHDTGVFVKQVPPVSIMSNSVTCNAGAGLHISAGSKATLEGNGIYDNRGHGVLIQGEATVQANDIFSNQLCAVIAEASADCKILNNRIHSLDNFALKVDPTLKVSVKENTFYQGEGQLCNEEKVDGNELAQFNTIVEQKLPEERTPLPKKAKGIDWHLENPNARPHIEAPPTVVPHMPARSVTMVTRVTVPSVPGCQQFSQICVIL